MRTFRVVLVLVMAGLSALHAQEVRLRPTAALYLDAAGVGMDGPAGVGFDGDSLLAIADTGNRRVLLYRVGGDRVEFASEIRTIQVPYPVHVRFVPGGELLVLDGRSHRIVRLSAAGEFLGYLDVPEPGRLDPLVRSFDVDRTGNVYALEAVSGRLLVLGPDGALRREVAYGPFARSLADVAVDAAGNVYAVDAIARRVLVARSADAAFGPLTEPMPEDMTLPAGIATDGEGHLYLADDHGSGIVILGQDGSFQGRESALGWKEGFLRYPSGLTVGKDLLFVADRGNSRVQIFTIIR
ncbi:MAG: NHL repeat-containing protein [Acidobacteriota bacterium]|jgi:hypothetical protein